MLGRKGYTEQRANCVLPCFLDPDLIPDVVRRRHSQWGCYAPALRICCVETVSNANRLSPPTVIKMNTSLHVLKQTPNKRQHMQRVTCCSVWKRIHFNSHLTCKHTLESMLGLKSLIMGIVYYYIMQGRAGQQIYLTAESGHFPRGRLRLKVNQTTRVRWYGPLAPLFCIEPCGLNISLWLS